MSTALYYLLSTVAQAIASAIALLGALLLFRLQSVGADIERNSLHLIEWRHNNDEMIMLLELHRSGKHGAVLDHFETGAGKRGPGTGEDYFATMRALRLVLDTRTGLLSRFQTSLSLTVGLIFVSVAAIPAVPKLASSDLYTGIAIAVVLIGLGACLATYVGIVRKILRG